MAEFLDNVRVDIDVHLPENVCLKGAEDMVREFQLKFHQAIDDPSVPILELRRALNAEEARETDLALVALIVYEREVAAGIRPVDPDYKASLLEEVVDGAMDTVYVLLGMMLALGVDSSAHFAEVHRANMSKDAKPAKYGEKYGAAGKGAGFVPPDHQALFLRTLRPARAAQVE